MRLLGTPLVEACPQWEHSTHSPLRATTSGFGENGFPSLHCLNNWVQRIQTGIELMLRSGCHRLWGQSTGKHSTESQTPQAAR